MFPPKLTHGDNLANLLEKYNRMIDYLRETRLVAGPGMRINRLPAGTTIESTATAVGSAASAPDEGNPHPFDMEIINKGTAESPSYYVRIFNSAYPDSAYAGVVSIGHSSINVPVTEIQVSIDGYFFVDIVVNYTNNAYGITFQVRPLEQSPQDGYTTTYRKTIGQGKLPSVNSWQSTAVEVLGRWV